MHAHRPNRPRPPRPATRLAAAFVGLVALAAGCGDDSGSDSGSGTAADATTTTEDLATEVSEAIDDLDLDDTECLLADEVVADIVGTEVTESGGNFGGTGLSVGDVEVSISYEGCEYVLSSGDELTVATAVDSSDGTPVEAFEQLRGLVGVDDDTFAVSDLGDDAVARREKLYVRRGDEVFYLDIDLVSDSTFDVDLLVPLAAEVLNVDAG